MLLMYSDGNLQMNNLEALIRKSGYSKKEFADLISNGIINDYVDLEFEN